MHAADSILSGIFVFCCMIIDDALLKTVRKSVDVLYIGALTGSGTAGWLMVPAFLLLVLVIPLQCVCGPRWVHSFRLSNSDLAWADSAFLLGLSDLQTLFGVLT